LPAQDASIYEEIMQLDDVWLAAVPTETGMLGIDCIENRLGRKLRRDAFTRYSQSAVDDGMPVSNRLKDRLSRHEQWLVSPADLREPERFLVYCGAGRPIEFRKRMIANASSEKCRRAAQHFFPREAAAGPAAGLRA
jgi:hypothetical protein